MNTPLSATLHDLPIAAADYIATHGWIQDKMENGVGAVCLTGALRACSPQPGDWLIARAVFRHQDRAEEWNDEAVRTADEVMGHLRDHPITDADLAEVFGPQWSQIIALVRRAATLTSEEMRDLDVARVAVRAALDAVWAAIRAANRPAAAMHSSDAAYAAVATEDAAVDAVANAAATTAHCAARALAVADLVGQYGLEQHHLDTLTAPWRAVIGDPLKGSNDE